MVLNNFAGIVEVDEFFGTYMNPVPNEAAAIKEIIARAHPSLKPAADAAKKANVEDDMSKPLIDYLKAVVSKFAPDHKPSVSDTKNKRFKSLDDDEKYTKPDITISRPGMKDPRTEWAHAGTVIELKYKTDIFSDDSGEVNESIDSTAALIQLAKSARSLLMASRSCHVYVVACFKNEKARILRFDRAGLRATKAFNWLTQPEIFPTFFYRLYHPSGPSRMDGDDDTIRLLTQPEKNQLQDALNTHDFYKEMDVEEVTQNSLCIKAVLCTDEAGEQVVDCFTVGDDLSFMDGLFSRATHVNRIILKDDLKEDKPPIYALKDAWRQACRRPEVDFYDMIARHCKNNDIDMDKEAMARCKGSIDLSVNAIDISVRATPPGETPLLSNPDLHCTRSTETKDPALERHHTRTLLMPVGSPLKSFQSTKSLAHALRNTVRHHQIAYEAGVLHRDVSEGNVLFQAVRASGLMGFLLDWDYAEFTPDGLESFKKEFPDRAKEIHRYTPINKSLKDFTGTLPFVAIEMIDPSNILHAAHHDLESFYWLLIWMIVRHTNHTHKDGDLACSRLFDPEGLATKKGFIADNNFPGQHDPLFQLADALRELVLYQHPPQAAGWNIVPILLTHETVLEAFDKHLNSEGWPKNDHALVFKTPSIDTARNNKAESRPSRVAVERATRNSTKRSYETADLDGSHTVASAGSAGTTAVSSSITDSDSRKPKKKKGLSGKAKERRT
ncbi:hypothetical protein K438DRAFT_2012560 [Mycena galopus ATCC 62051]|nr:hypothetical protein K438DRAFT_2012560 [Mycena galopus ATCC 62051]